MAPDTFPDPIAIAIEFGALLDRLRIPYVIGGSFASSVHGEPRSTNDVDIVVDLSADVAGPLLDALEPGYYVSRDAMRDAIASGGSFNVIHLAGGLKVDLFVAGRDAFDRERLRTREELQLPEAPDQPLHIDTAENVILRKLEWFRRGGEVSERQWRDVIGILRVLARPLDEPRMRQWADTLGVSDLLSRARAEAEADRPG